MATVVEVMAALKAHERTLVRGTTARNNLKAIRRAAERYSLGTTLVAGGTLNMTSTYWTTWDDAARTVTLAAGTVTVSS